MKATIITIGDEILIGQIVDTNSVSIAKHLNAAGITVHEKISIGDTAPQIEQTLAHALAQTEVVIITGGLGPTKDDITKFTLAKIFSSGMHEDKRVADHVRTMLERRGIEYNALNQSQAMVPDCCTVLFNAHGTAPGMWFEDAEDRVTVSLPGVPFEMEHLMEDEVMPRLKAHFALHANIHRTMITAGLPESMLAARIEQWEDALPENIKLAYLPAPNIVRLRLSAYDAEDGEAMRQQIDAEFEKLYKIIPEHIVGFENATMQELVHKILIERGLTLSTAESCTGGTIASRFTAMAGASAYFLGGVVAYANEAKRDILGVNYDNITHYGAVSEQVVRQMAEGARRITGADYAIATSGIAGPAGGSAEKPVGTVWMAVATPTQTIATLRNCGTDRGQIINRASAYAIEMLYNQLKQNN
ncbi:MAG: CinA family nicotinamide mononucleotide deamidase-related protein [Alistipes sp.]|nr:CinA family nicotinamide mononucleotide deamidase-related protein [Alistipes sp.]